MLKKLIFLGLNSILMMTTLSCNKNSETNINVEVKSPEIAWQVIKGEKIALALPEKFVGGNPTRELNLLTENLKKIDCVTEKTTEKLEQNAKNLALIAFLPECESNHLVTSINIIADKIKPEINLDQYLINEVNKLKNNTNIIEQEIIKNNQENIGKIITETNLENLTIKQLFYIIPKDQNYWIITYTSPVNKFSENLPIFEKSFKSFQVL